MNSWEHFLLDFSDRNRCASPGQSSLMVVQILQWIRQLDYLMPSLASKKLSKFLQAIWMLNLQMVLSYFFNLNIFFPKLAHLLILNLFYYIQSPLDYKESNQSVLKQSILNTHWKDSCWSCSSNILTTWCEEPTHWKRPWCWGRLRAGGEGGDRGWDGWISSLTQWTWIWAISKG